MFVHILVELRQEGRRVPHSIRFSLDGCVAVPPGLPRVLGDRGRQLSQQHPVGPFKEGDPLTVQCVATGGDV